MELEQGERGGEQGLLGPGGSFFFRTHVDECWTT